MTVENDFLGACRKYQGSVVKELSANYPEICISFVQMLPAIFGNICRLGDLELVKWYGTQLGDAIMYSHCLSNAFHSNCPEVADWLFQNLLTCASEQLNDNGMLLEHVCNKISDDIAYFRQICKVVRRNQRIQICVEFLEAWVEEYDPEPIDKLFEYISIFPVDDFWHPDVQEMLSYNDVFTEYMNDTLPEKREIFMRCIAPHLPTAMT